MLEIIESLVVLRLLLKWLPIIFVGGSQIESYHSVIVVLNFVSVSNLIKTMLGHNLEKTEATLLEFSHANFFAKVLVGASVWRYFKLF